MSSTNDGRGRVRGGWWFLAPVVMVVVAIACGQSDENAASRSALLAGSNFEAADGDLAVPNTSGAAYDWNYPVEPIACPATAPGAGTNCGLDLVGSQADNSFTQGPKEDDEAPAVSSGSIPPNKDDLSRFYVNTETVNVGGTDNEFLYLAWERSNTLGSAHMDFEFNQSSTPSANGVTPVRTAGDLLIDFDFGGSGTPTLAYHVWTTSGNPALVCEANNTVPCWGKAINLGAFAEASVNGANVTDENPPNAPFILPGSTTTKGGKTTIDSTFGEAAINLTGAGIFTPGVCRTFGAATLKSRSSGESFTSSLKDFIGPIDVDISNCGIIKIIKHTNPRGLNQNFGYTTTGGLSPAAFTLNDNGLSSDVEGANMKTYEDVLAGTYTVTEGADPSGFAFGTLSCTASGSGTSALTSGKTATITLAGGGVVTCTYVNNQQLGAIKVTKTRKHAADGPGDHPHAGVSFTVNGVTQVTDANGVTCFDGLLFGSYAVTETLPSGYSADDGLSKNVTVDNNAACADNPYVGETVTFGNTPRTNITVSVDSQVDGGTASTISCVDALSASVASGSTGANGDGSATASNLLPGTYTCTVVVDP